MVSESSGQLRRILGIGFGLAIIVGSTIGVGILRTPGMVAGQLRSPSTILLFWLGGGLYTMLGVVCLTELGTMLPQAGGYYVYVRRAFGDTAGFAVGWADWLTYCAVLGYVSIGIAEFVGVLVPSVAGFVRVIGVAALLGLVGLQWLGLRVSSRFQEIATAIKFVAFLALIVACLTATSTTAAAVGERTAPTLSGMVLALQAVVITYGGWQSALYFTEEDRDPSRNLPKTMIGGIVSVIVIYLLVNFALLKVLPMGAFAASPLPAADAAQIFAGNRGRDLITLLSIVSLVPLLNAIMMIGARIMFGLGRDGLMWRPMATVNPGGTPTVAMVITTVVAVGLIATGTFQRLIALTAFWLAANYCACCIALIVLRRREPQTPRPFRAWGYPWSAAIVVAGAVVFLAAALIGDTWNGLAAIGLTAAGVAVRKLI